MKKLMLLAILAASFIMMYSCGQNTPVDSQSSNSSNSMSVIANEVLPDNLLPSLCNPDIIEGSLDGEIGYLSEMGGPRDGKGPNDRKPNLGDKRDGQRLDRGFKFRDIFFYLKLTKEQRPLIQQILIDHANCVRTVMEATAAQRKAILDAANQEIRAIIQQVKDGTLDRATASTQIKAINERVRTDLQALVDTDALCRCWTVMVDAIKAVLTPDQLAIYEKWLANMPNPCDPSTTGRKP